MKGTGKVKGGRKGIHPPRGVARRASRLRNCTDHERTENRGDTVRITSNSRRGAGRLQVDEMQLWGMRSLLFLVFLTVVPPGMDN